MHYPHLDSFMNSDMLRPLGATNKGFPRTESKNVISSPALMDSKRTSSELVSHECTGSAPARLKQPIFEASAGFRLQRSRCCTWPAHVPWLPGRIKWSCSRSLALRCIGAMSPRSQPQEWQDLGQSFLMN
eukprot:CAMPEP_0181256976 /NCGR_PEP_ID=MMETSP1096-20121128/50003_1 /TAXON_ID=156174 ORGANISM="Chrysochromulina ericina, Strain CCMP281" /NCGR_SAMPLE_ID=MMETSP1096 /ASSEMBLY_ACC=CAM_ASM_000453 /LENGTH=129 /DNA_ID=CAMNT_0023355273 /DNA_START=320 /DNA_END=709 /DNA_ORIENTATION=-